MSWCRYPACSAASGFALLHRKVFHTFHEVFRGRRGFSQVRRPIQRSRRQHHIASHFPDVDFASLELELLGQAHRLAPVIHENFGFSLHGSLPAPSSYGIYMKYMPAADMSATPALFGTHFWGAESSAFS